MKQNGWTDKETKIQEDFIWDIGPVALYQMILAEYKTEPDKKEINDLIRLFNDYISTKKKYLSQPRRILLNKTKCKRDTGKLLAQSDRNPKGI